MLDNARIDFMSSQQHGFVALHSNIDLFQLTANGFVIEQIEQIRERVNTPSPVNTQKCLHKKISTHVGSFSHKKLLRFLGTRSHSKWHVEPGYANFLVFLRMCSHCSFEGFALSGLDLWKQALQE